MSKVMKYLFTVTSLWVVSIIVTILYYRTELINIPVLEDILWFIPVLLLVAIIVTGCFVVGSSRGGRC